FIERGRRRIVYISVDPRDASVARERLRGARDALRAAGQLRDIPGGAEASAGSAYREDGIAAYREDLAGRDGLPVAVSGFDWRGGCEAMSRLLEACPDADAVLCATDTIALGAMICLREAGRRVPEDISVAGVGDDWADLVSHPPLTAAQLDQFRCGREAASILLDLLENPEAEPKEVRLGYTVVDRGTV
ncbi:MAG: substrate-binding domain-containing protein, partial [Oscillibacter sp.]|nr:substrate-binding domain-containing protein [Oscillibacter sp.]